MDLIYYFTDLDLNVAWSINSGRRCSQSLYNWLSMDFFQVLQLKMWAYSMFYYILPLIHEKLVMIWFLILKKKLDFQKVGYLIL